jgi:hypothetical protein
MPLNTDARETFGDSGDGDNLRKRCVQRLQVRPHGHRPVRDHEQIVVLNGG